MTLTTILFIVIGIQAVAIVFLLFKWKSEKKYYEEKLDKIHRAWNTSYRQLKGMEELFTNR